MGHKNLGIVAVVYFCLFFSTSFVAYSDGLLDDDEESEKHSVYASPELIIGNYWGVGINWTYTYDQSYSVQIGTSWMGKRATRPDDYYAFESFVAPLDHLTHIHITLGKIFYLNDIKTIRLNLSVGAASTSICEPRNWEKRENPEYNYISESHTYQHFEYDKISFVAFPSIEFIPVDFLGFYISPSYIYNSDRSFSGVKLGVILGKIK